MPKYSPENKGKLERRVKEFDSKTSDRAKHMNNVVKYDAKAIADVSKKIRSGGTIEADKEINRAIQQASEKVKEKYGHEKKSIDDLMEKGGKIKSELKERGKDSKSNYKKLTKASDSIKETPAAKKGLDHGRQVAQENIYIMDSLHDVVYRAMQRTGQRIQELDYKIASTLHFFGSGAKAEYMDAEKKRSNRKIEAENGDLRKRMEAGQHLQKGKQVQVANEISKKRDNDYGRRSVIPDENNNLYKQKDTYQNE